MKMRRPNFWAMVSEKLDMKKWKLSEMDAADSYGKLTPGSGNTSHNKGDIVGQEEYSPVRIENKHTEAKSFSLNKKYLREQIKQCRVLHGTELVFRIDFDGETYMVLREDYFRNIFND